MRQRLVLLVLVPIALSVIAVPTAFAAQTKPKITVASFPRATVGVDYWAVMTTADGRHGTWRIAAGALPDGVHIVDGDVVSGVPSAVETAHFTLAFKDRRGRAVHVHRSITVAPGHWAVSGSPNYEIACGAATCYRSNAADRIEARASGTGFWAPTPLQNADELGDAYTTHIACAPDSATSCALTAIKPADEDEGAVYRMLLAATDESGSWVFSDAPTPDGVNGEIRLDAVTCQSDECIAVGEGGLADQPDTAGYFGLPVIETYRDGSWTARTLPYMQASGVLGTHLSAVGCEPGGDFCFAQGSAVIAQGTNVKTVEFGVDLPPTGPLLTFGSDLTDFGVPGDQVHTDALACQSATSCTVLGHYGDRRTPFYLSISNLRIRPHAFEPPPGTRSRNLHFVSLACGSRACFAVGSVHVHGQVQPVVARMVGRAENTYRVRYPGGASDSGSLQSVACGSDAACVAGASWTLRAHGVKRALGVARLGANSASVEQVAEDPSPDAPFGTGAAHFDRLSCGTWCYGVAHFSGGHYVQVTPTE
jgi:hypothetical protein